MLTYYHAFANDKPSKAREQLLNMDWNDCATLALTDLGGPTRSLITL